jgi:hypothetical protein
MNWLYKIIAVSLVLSITLAKDANAQAKVDISKTAGKVVGFVTTTGKKATKTVEESSVYKQANKFGEGVKSWSKKGKELRDRAKAEAEDFKKVKASVEKDIDKVQEITSEAQKLADEKSAYLKEIKELEEEKKDLDVQTTSEISSQQVVIQGKLDALTSSDATYNALIAENPELASTYSEVLAQNAAQRTSLQQELDEYVTEKEETKETKSKSIDKRIKELYVLAGKLLAGDVEKIATTLFSKKTDAAAENEKTANETFLAKGQAQNIANTEKLMATRKLDAAEKTVKAFAVSSKLQKVQEIKTQYGDELVDEIALQDGVNDATSLQTNLQMEQMLSLINIMRAQVQDLKASVAQELAKMNTYPRRDYEIDQGSLNLCNYKYDPKNYRKKD